MKYISLKPISVPYKFLYKINMFSLIFNINVTCIINISAQTFQIQCCKITKSNAVKLPNHFESFQIENNNITPLYFHRKGIQTKPNFFIVIEQDCTSWDNKWLIEASRHQNKKRFRNNTKRHQSKKNNTRHLIYNRSKPIKLDLKQDGEGYRRRTMWLSSSYYRFCGDAFS